MEKSYYCMLSTSDNPFDPNTEWDNWLFYDETHGYHSCSVLDRFAYIGSGLPQIDRNEIIEEAIDEIIKVIPGNNFIKLKYSTETDKKLAT